MHAVRFHAVIGDDRVIRLPADLEVAPGSAEVILLQPEISKNGAPGSTEPPKEHLFDRLARLADELGIDTSQLPSDLAENHDHYLHGLPKGIDRQ